MTAIRSHIYDAIVKILPSEQVREFSTLTSNVAIRKFLDRHYPLPMGTGWGDVQACEIVTLLKSEMERVA